MAQSSTDMVRHTFTTLHNTSQGMRDWAGVPLILSFFARPVRDMVVVGCAGMAGSVQGVVVLGMHRSGTSLVTVRTHHTPVSLASGHGVVSGTVSQVPGFQWALSFHVSQYPTSAGHVFSG